VAERQAEHWAREARGCVSSQASTRPDFVVAMRVDTQGFVHIDPPIVNRAGEAALTCIRKVLDGQTLGRISVPMTVFWQPG
jgi:hypothetical protein